MSCPRTGGLGQGQEKNRNPRQKNSPAQARAGREGKGVWGKGIPAPPERFLEIGVGIFLKIGSDFNQKIPPVWSFRVFWTFRLAPASPGLGFLNEIPGIFKKVIHRITFCFLPK